MTFIVTLAAGIFALIGMVGIFFGVASRATDVGQRAFGVGRVAMAVAGLVSLVGGMTGILDTASIFGGVMMLIFGTAVSLPVAAREATAA